MLRGVGSWVFTSPTGAFFLKFQSLPILATRQLTRTNSSYFGDIQSTVSKTAKFFKF